MGRTNHNEASFAALGGAAGGITAKTHDEFLNIRREAGAAKQHAALAARYPATPFNRLVMLDTAGTSSGSLESILIHELPGQADARIIIVTDIEYWSAKHTMDFIAFYKETFGDGLLIVANKADHLNADEIQRIAGKAHKRLEAYGISPAPRFFALSARLEIARGTSFNEYRNRTKPNVRAQCDAGFDAFRVALYEFEAARTSAAAGPSFEQLLEAPLAAAFISAQQGTTP